MLRKVLFLLFLFELTSFIGSAFAQNKIEIDIGGKHIKFVEPENKDKLDINSGTTTIEIINFDQKKIGVQFLLAKGRPINISEDFIESKKGSYTNKIELLIKEGKIQTGTDTLRELSSPFDLRVIVDSEEMKITDIGIGKGVESVTKGKTAREFLQKRRDRQIQNPYKNDEVYLFFDQDGKQIGRVPKNVDEDDEFIITIVARKTEIDKYDIIVEEGEYAPSDFSLRPSEELRENEATASCDKPEESWDLLEFKVGPFTTDHFRFTITYDDKENPINLKTYSIPINNLYHAALGVSFLTTKLEDPSFDVAPLTGTTNTIIKLDGGDRGIIAVNVIWYWRIFHRDFWSGSVLTKGRDILKELPWHERIYPTFGVSLDGNFRENFFYGVVWEFARGANITYGLHSGKGNCSITCGRF